MIHFGSHTSFLYLIKLRKNIMKNVMLRQCSLPKYRSGIIYILIFTSTMPLGLGFNQLLTSPPPPCTHSLSESLCSNEWPLSLDANRVWVQNYYRHLTA